VLNQPFLQITLPLMVTFVAAIWVASWTQNKRIDELSKRLNDFRDSVNKRLDAIEKRLERIEEKLENHAEPIAKLEASKWR
jgi:hypothetical protein